MVGGLLVPASQGGTLSLPRLSSHLPGSGHGYRHYAGIATTASSNLQRLKAKGKEKKRLKGKEKDKGQGNLIPGRVFQKLFFYLFVRVKSHHFLHHTTWLGITTVALSALVSLARITALYQGYHAATDVWMRVNQLPLTGPVKN